MAGLSVPWMEAFGPPIPPDLLAVSFPVGATAIGLPLAAAMFTTGWAFQLMGHAEGNKPTSVVDRHALLAGLA